MVEAKPQADKDVVGKAEPYRTEGGKAALADYLLLTAHCPPLTAPVGA